MMNGYVPPLRDTEGAALVTAMLMIAALTAIGLFSLNTTILNQEIAGQLKASKQAFYLADAGIQWGKAQVRNSTAMPPVAVGSSVTQPSGAGTMTVSFPAQNPAGVAMQYTVAIRATGTVGRATRTIDALVTKTYNLGDAPIALRGVEANSGFTGNSFEIDGRDYVYNPDTDSWEATGTMGLGVTVSNATLQSQVLSALSQEQRDNIIGQGGPPSVGISTSFPSSAITDLANALCDATPAGNQTTIAASSTLDLKGKNTWGNQTTPQIHCVTGTGTPSKPATLDISGTFSGAGILVVRDAQLIASGAFHYEGLIITTGSHTGFTLRGSGNKEVFGAVMVNELSGDTQLELEAQGAVKLRASRSALAVASQLFSGAAWDTLLPVAPTEVLERSWREVSQ